MSNPVVHFEILGPDGSALIDFYKTLFGWPLHDNPLAGWPHYGQLDAKVGIGGAVGTADAIQGAGVLVYIEVDDPQVYVERAVSMGAQVVLPLRPVPGTQVTVAWLRDPQGNLLGLVKSRPEVVVAAT